MHHRSIVAGVAMLALALAACSSDDPDSSGDTRSLAIVAPEDGATVEGNVVTLDFNVENVTIVGADGDTSGNSGHFHVFVDRDPVGPGETIPKESGIIHTTDDPLTITGLSAGEHRFVVVLGDGTHSRIGDLQDEVTVTVAGPAIEASASVEGSIVTVTVDSVDGATVTAGDPPSPDHLHYFLDKEPALDGSAIPVDDPAIIHSRETTVTFEGVAAGEHTIHVVLANGEHIPYDPPVMATLKVTVA